MDTQWYCERHHMSNSNCSIYVEGVPAKKAIHIIWTSLNDITPHSGYEWELCEIQGKFSHTKWDTHACLLQGTKPTMKIKKSSTVFSYTSSSTSEWVGVLSGKATFGQKRWKKRFYISTIWQITLIGVDYRIVLGGRFAGETLAGVLRTVRGVAQALSG